MKADKILFGMACLAMAYMVHTAANQNSCQGPKTQQTTMLDTINKNCVSHNLSADTISFSNAVKKDTLNLLRKIK